MTIEELLKQADITQFNKPIKWGRHCPCDKQGVYIVSFCEDPTLEMAPTEPLFNDAEIREWIKCLPEFTLNNKRPTVEEVKQKLRKFWHPNENILYIGNTTKANRHLSKRIEEYYITNLGESGPHAGGQWLKTLTNFRDTYIHYFPTNSLEIKPLLLDCFKMAVGEIPFANLRIRSRQRSHINYDKQHGFKKQTKK